MGRDLRRRLAVLEATSRAPAPDPGRDVMAELLDRLERMAANERARPGWREPTPEEQAEGRRLLASYFAERFGVDIPPG